MIRKSLFLFFIAVGLIGVANGQEGQSSRVERTIVVGGAPSTFIGVDVRDVSKQNYLQYGLSDIKGVAVEGVTEDSPASKAGVIKGDVIVKFDGESVTSVRKLQRLVSEVAPDQTAQLTVIRNGTEIQLPVVVARREEPGMNEGRIRLEGLPGISVPDFPGFDLAIPRTGDSQPRIFSTMIGGRQIGVSVVPVTEQLSQYFGVAAGHGLMISEVKTGSPSAKAGLRAGDVIVSVDGTSVKDNLDLVREINRNKDGAVRLTIIRNKKEKTFDVTPEEVKNDRPVINRVLPGAPVM